MLEENNQIADVIPGLNNTFTGKLTTTKTGIMTYEVTCTLEKKKYKFSG